MRSSFRSGDLQTIVIGKEKVPLLIDVVEVWKMAKENRALSLIGCERTVDRGGGAVIVISPSAREAEGRWGESAGGRVYRVPAPPDRWLIDVNASALFVPAVVADVGHIHGEAVGDRALNVEIPFGSG